MCISSASEINSIYNGENALTILLMLRSKRLEVNMPYVLLPPSDACHPSIDAHATLGVQL